MTAVELPLPAGAAAAAGAPAVAMTVDRVFTSLGSAVHGYVKAAGAHDSEDVLSEVFVRVARRLDRFRGDECDLRRWVFTIARHCLIDDHRRRVNERHLLRRWVAKEDAPPTLESSGSNHEPLDPELLTALRRLTPDQREVVTLRFVADLSVDEVARITGRAAGSVKSLQHRALRSLATRLTPRASTNKTEHIDA